MRTRLILAVLLIAACAGLVRLGFWQLDRAAQKHARYTAFAERMAARPVAFDSLAGDELAEAFRWRRVTVSGHYQEFDVLLDNRTRAGRAGYEVLSPFVTEGGRMVMVNRGWIPMPPTRETVPDAIAPADPTTLTGFLGDEPVVGITLAEHAEEAEWLSPRVLRVQRVMLDGLAPLLGAEPAPVVVYLDAGALGALATDWPLPGDGSAKHTAYAVQWFAMATVLALIGGWNLRRKKPLP